MRGDEFPPPPFCAYLRMQERGRCKCDVNLFCRMRDGDTEREEEERRWIMREQQNERGIERHEKHFPSQERGGEVRGIHAHA